MNTSTKYAVLDDAILSQVGTEPKRFVTLYSGLVVTECDRIGAEEGIREPFRVADRRLQALRRAGKIASTTKGWIKA